MFATHGLDPGGATREAGVTLTPSTDQAGRRRPSSPAMTLLDVNASDSLWGEPYAGFGLTK